MVAHPHGYTLLSAYEALGSASSCKSSYSHQGRNKVNSKDCAVVCRVPSATAKWDWKPLVH